MQMELTLEGAHRDPQLVQAYAMQLVLISRGVDSLPTDLEKPIGNTGCPVGKVLRRCPILVVGVLLRELQRHCHRRLVQILFG